MLTQDPSHRGRRDTDTELSQLSLDADTSPASVLSTQSDDELDQLFVHRRSARTSLVSPSPPLVFGRFAVQEHHDLDVLVGLGPTCRPDEAEESAQAEVDESEGHGG